MSFVLDSSAALSWCFQEEQTPESLALFERSRREIMYVPALWHIEVANILAISFRKGRLGDEPLNKALRLLTELPLEVEPLDQRASIGHLLFLCQASGLTAYDASFLNLALRLHLPLATYDVKLARAATRAGVDLLLPVQ